ncbi:MAG: SDR family NAD(P)-dependent oxidoreductase [Pseudomonadales bacterium]|nr:SDR family NAD(P)-dependent oxidoreductase [Pseudomonadales bacterium]
MNQFETPNFSIDLSNDVALVTGTTSGLGRRFAKVLAKCGAKVALTGRRVDKLETLKQEIIADGGVCEAFSLDMQRRDSVRDVVESCSEILGPISILVNNAGIPDAQRATKMSDELIDSVMETNLTGPYILSCEVAKRMIAKEIKGRIVNISSIAAFDVNAHSSASLYSVTKSGIARMTEVLALEWAKYNINVNAIAPGAFSSEMMDGMVERIGDFSQAFPRKRFGQPEQMDSTLLFLVSPSSECVTGTVIRIDDGQSHR